MEPAAANLEFGNRKRSFAERYSFILMDHGSIDCLIKYTNFAWANEKIAVGGWIGKRYLCAALAGYFTSPAYEPNVLRLHIFK